MNAASRSRRGLALALLMALGGASARAEETSKPTGPVDQADALDDVRYVVGLTASNGPIYYGQTQRSTGFHPMFALRWGKVRLSSSGAGGLIGEANAGGASTDLLRSDRWLLRAALRIDRGRRIEDDTSNRLSDLPRVRGTLRGRLSLTRGLDADSSLSLTLSPDLLGRGGGTVMSLGYYRRLPDLDEWIGFGGHWSMSAGISGGDDRYMNSYFGVPQGALRFPSYEAEGGLRDTTVGLGWQRAFGDKQQWVMFGGAGAQRLLGAAANAPFVERRNTWSANLGLAYRH